MHEECDDASKKCHHALTDRYPEAAGDRRLRRKPCRDLIEMRHWADRVVAFLFALAVLLAAPPGRAATLDEALQRFTADDFSETEAGIGEVAESGNPLAARVLAALGDGRLLYSAEKKKVFIKDRQDRVLDAATGQPITGNPPGDIDTVNVNNRLRRAIDAALGALTLLDPDPGRRYDAAQAVFKSKEENALPALEKAIARETNARAKKAMTEARAAIVLGSDAAEADKVAAVAVIRERGDQDSLALLSSLPADSPPAVARAAKDAVATIQHGLAMWSGVQNAWYGLSLGSVLLLAAIGLAI